MQPIGGLGKATRICIAVAIAVNVGRLLIMLAFIDMSRAMLPELNSILRVANVLDTLATWTFVVALVPLFLWIYRAHANLRASDAKDMDYPSAWAVIGWFVPLINLVHPYSVMKDLSRESRALGEEEFVLREETAPWSDHRVGWWWGLFLFSRASSWMVTSSIRVTAQDVTAMLWLNICSLLAVCAAGFLFFRIVGSVTEQQEAAMTTRLDDLEAIEA